MRRLRLVATLCMTMVLGGPFAGRAPAEELSDAEFQRLHKELMPDESDLWRTVPWKIALLDAQRTAAREKKPIFIWAMDGHPLGCT